MFELPHGHEPWQSNSFGRFGSLSALRMSSTISFARLVFSTAACADEDGGLNHMEFKVELPASIRVPFSPRETTADDAGNGGAADPAGGGAGASGGGGDTVEPPLTQLQAYAARHCEAWLRSRTAEGSVGGSGGEMAGEGGGSGDTG